MSGKFTKRVMALVLALVIAVPMGAYGEFTYIDMMGGGLFAIDNGASFDYDGEEPGEREPEEEPEKEPDGEPEDEEFGFMGFDPVFAGIEPFSDGRETLVRWATAADIAEFPAQPWLATEPANSDAQISQVGGLGKGTWGQNSLSTNGWDIAGRHLLIEFSSEGYENLRIEGSFRATGTGPRFLQLEYNDPVEGWKLVPDGAVDLNNSTNQQRLLDWLPLPNVLSDSNKVQLRIIDIRGSV